jgi:subtilase family serine protease
MPTQVAQVAQAPQQFMRAALSIDAFPISIDAFPITIDAFPVSISAFPICQNAPTTASAACHAQYRTDLPVNANPFAPASQLLGYAPSDLQNAYGVTQAASYAGGSQTVAIVVAYRQNNLESDLAVYRRAYGLPRCSSNNGCLNFISDGGGQGSDSSVRSAQDNGNNNNSGWAAEAALDAEMVSALCPNCNIMVSQANSSSIPDLARAVDAAVQAGATVVSNSYSVPEAADNAAYESHYNHPGVPITAGAGDRGYGVGFPASSPHVTAVGGTSLVRTSGNGWGLIQFGGGSYGNSWGEAVWPGTGSGCSAFFAKPSWQRDSGCSHRTVNDVAVVADPATGVAAYSSASGGWNVFGGTSVGAPLVAAMYALAGDGSNINDASGLYARPWSFAPVTLRANGKCAPNNYLCTAGPGYDGPTGLGVPGNLAPF